MPYVLRNDSGAIIGVTDMAAADGAQWLAETDAELIAFLQREAEKIQLAKAALHESDVEMARVVEDLIELMIEKGMIRYTDLPEGARRKIDSRVRMRRSLNVLDDLMVGEHDIL